MDNNLPVELWAIFQRYLTPQLTERILGAAQLSEADQRKLRCDCLEHLMYLEIYNLSMLLEPQPALVLGCHILEWQEAYPSEPLSLEVRQAVEWVISLWYIARGIYSTMDKLDVRTLVGGDDEYCTFLNPTLMDFIAHSPYRLLSANLSEAVCERTILSLRELRQEARLEVTDEEIRELEGSLSVADTHFHAGDMDAEQFIRRMVATTMMMKEKYELFDDDEDC